MYDEYGETIINFVKAAVIYAGTNFFILLMFKPKSGHSMWLRDRELHDTQSKELGVYM